MNKKQQETNVSGLPAELFSGVSPLRNIRRSDKLCPTCNETTVDKDYRVCRNCHQRLFWDGDDCEHAVERNEDFYVWHKNMWNMSGWTHKSFLHFSMLPHPMLKNMDKAFDKQ